MRAYQGYANNELNPVASLVCQGKYQIASFWFSRKVMRYAG